MIVLLVIGILIFCTKRRGRWNTPIYMYNKKEEALDNPTYMGSQEWAGKSGDYSTLDLHYEHSRKYTAENSDYATIN